MDDWTSEQRTGNVLKPNTYISQLSAIVHIVVNALASVQCMDAHGVDVDVSIKCRPEHHGGALAVCTRPSLDGGLWHERFAIALSTAICVCSARMRMALMWM